MSYWTYILCNKPHGTLYVGMTDDLPKRMWLHRNETLPGFTKQYGVKMLVWSEVHESRESALLRERRFKKWNRKWKLELIECSNPTWRDLGDGLAA